MWSELGEPLEGEIVALEPLGPEHEHALRQAGSDPAVWRWMVVHGHEREAFSRWFEASLRAKEEGREAPFAVVPRATGKPIGSTRYMSLRPEHRGLEIGYTWIGRSWQKSHVNTACKRLLLGHAFETLGCKVVGLRTDRFNLNSQRAIEALGAKKDGVLRHHTIRKDGSVRDTVMYTILVTEWPDVRTHLEWRLARYSRRDDGT